VLPTTIRLIVCQCFAQSESKAESVSLTLSNNTVCSNCNRSSENNRNNSIILCEEETQSSTSESNNEKERRTQLWLFSSRWHLWTLCLRLSY